MSKKKWCGLLAILMAVSIVFTPSRYMMQKMEEARFAPAVTYHP